MGESPVDSDVQGMQVALQAAQEAARRGEVPVGAAAVYQGRLLCTGFNERERRPDPTAHAEILVLREAARILGAWRLAGVSLYVTLEPCAMCAGALVQARVERLVYGARDPKAGAVDSLFGIGRDLRLNHRFEVRGGVEESACSELLRSFFRARRR
jgi:tRNA(adenine34) deaminase